MFLVKRIVCLSIAFFIASVIYASEEPSRCTNVNFPLDNNGNVDRPQPVRVIVQDTPVYADQSSSKIIKTLDFDASLMVENAESSRIQVRLITSTEPLGWVERSALLCAFTPRKSDKGLEQKLYIRTATEVREGKPATVKAYQSPDMKTCVGKCRELSRFTGYFVFDETEGKDGAYLLSGYYRLDPGYKLVGWVSKKNGFIWNTAYGLRPKENLVFEKGSMKEQEKAVCAYGKIEDALNDKNCIPILGGDRWFLIEHRIPLIDRVDKQGRSFYKVVLPIAGTGGKRIGEGKVIRIAPDELGESRGISSLLNMKNIDVLFLIDGTKTMEQFIESIRGSKNKPGVIQEIIEALKDDPTFEEAQFRFGFRIYRDAYAGKDELGEGLPMSSECELTHDTLSKNKDEFDKTIKMVRATPGDLEIGKDDYAENLFGGIEKAIKDLGPCPTHTKLLFIIGDNGYDANAQRRRGRTPVKMNSLIKKLKGSQKKRLKNIVTFFIQTPNGRNHANHPEQYDKAYRLFKNQAYEILRHILPSGNRPDEYFLQSNDRALNRKIIGSVKGFSNTQVVNELILDLRGGTSLKDAIERLQGSKEYNNIPGLFWNLVEQTSAQELGKQYDNRIYDAVLNGYIPVSEDVVEDVWLKSNDLGDWELLLKQFGDQTHLSGSKLREAFGFAIKDSLEKVIRKPPYDATQESLGKYLERIAGLPARDDSPLFQYSLNDLSDESKVPACELIRLTIWINNVRQMLSIVRHGDMRPDYTPEKFSGECQKGDKIPFISGDIKNKPVGKSPEMRFDHDFQRAHIYWIPKEYLP